MPALIHAILLALALGLSSTARAGDVIEWSTAVSRQPSTGRAIVYRFASAFESGFRQDSLPFRVVVSWPYRSESGMPVGDEHRAMDRLEDRLGDLPERQGFSVLALVATGENLRTWTFYVRSDREFLSEWNAALSNAAPPPVEMRIERDPQWTAYTDFLRDVRR